ncbi:MAG: ATP-binding protein [Conexivisphaerales archaeon]
MEVVVIGPSGTGKSTWVGEMIKDVEREDHHVIILDDSLFYTKFLPNALVYEVTHNKQFPNGISYANYLLNDRSLKRISDLIIKSANLQRPLLFEVNDVQTAEAVQLIDIISAVILKNFKNILLVIDEAFRLTPRYKGSKILLQLLRSGRKRGINEIIIYQQFADTDSTMIRQADYAVAFKPQGVSEIDNFIKTFGVDRSVVEQMGPHDHLSKNMRTGQIEIVHQE